MPTLSCSQMHHLHIFAWELSKYHTFYGINFTQMCNEKGLKYYKHVEKCMNHICLLAFG